MDQISCDASDRLLVFAPHPDDESLACGGLIQRAQRAGAVVSVVIATNGDANPWPQRLIEKRWNLGPDAARRWGAVRHAEAAAALQALGISIDNARFLQWADQGLTKRLLDDGNASVKQLRQLIATHRPTLVAMPSVLDSHPDHSALALMLMAALRSEDSQARAISYWLHGRNGQQHDVSHVALTQEELVGKRAAALAHVSHFASVALRRADRGIYPSQHGRATKPANVALAVARPRPAGSRRGETPAHRGDDLARHHPRRHARTAGCTEGSVAVQAIGCPHRADPNARALARVPIGGGQARHQSPDQCV